ncbi:MAG: hypothetical protein GY731_12150 [Gammaproteobacteria bacterium]|nr:hypothetical protein [Gammaproteobacteria bacterium]
METRRIPLQEETCDDSINPAALAGASREYSGNVRTRQPGITLAQAIRQDLHLNQRYESQPEHHCRQAENFRTQEHPIGYRVVYRYDDKLFVRRMDHHPGTRVRVRVALITMP